MLATPVFPRGLTTPRAREGLTPGCLDSRCRSRSPTASVCLLNRPTPAIGARRLAPMRGVWLEKVGGPWSVSEVADREVIPGGVLVDVVAVRVPSYTRQVLTGELGYDLPAPLVPGPTCIGRVRAVADDVFGVGVGEMALCNSLYSSGEVVGSPDEILIGWTGTGSA